MESDLFVFESFPVDQESVPSQQFVGPQPAHADSAQAAVLRQPAAARIVSGHHHRFDAHNVAVTTTRITEGQLASVSIS